MDGGGRHRPLPGAPVPSAGNVRRLLLGLHTYAVAVAPVRVPAPSTRYTTPASMVISARMLTTARDRARMSLARLQAPRACWCAVPGTPSSPATTSVARVGWQGSKPRSRPHRLTQRRWVLSRQVEGSPSIASCSHSSAFESAAHAAATKDGPVPPPVASWLALYRRVEPLRSLEHPPSRVHRCQSLSAVRVIPHRVHGEVMAVLVASHDLQRKARPGLATSISVAVGPALVILVRVRALLYLAHRPNPTPLLHLVRGTHERPALLRAPTTLRLVAQWLQQVPRDSTKSPGTSKPAAG